MGKAGQGRLCVMLRSDLSCSPDVPVSPGWRFRYSALAEAARSLEICFLLTQLLPSAIRCEMKGASRIYRDPFIFPVSNSRERKISKSDLIPISQIGKQRLT